MVTIPSTQAVGQPLTLECVGATVRGITSRVDIVWRRSRRVVRNIHGASPTINNPLVYTDSYTISQLSTADEGRVYQCRLVIRTSDPVRGIDAVKLNVIGEYFTETMNVS